MMTKLAIAFLVLLPVVAQAQWVDFGLIPANTTSMQLEMGTDVYDFTSIQINDERADAFKITMSDGTVVFHADTTTGSPAITIGASVTPRVDGTYNLGADAVRWAFVYADTLDASAGFSGAAITVTADVTAGDDLIAIDDLTVGDDATISGRLTVPGSGIGNELFGASAGASMSGTTNSTFLGRSAGQSATNLDKCILIGGETGQSMTGGLYDIAIGYRAMENAAPVVGNNVAIGDWALRYVTGSNNLALGDLSGYNVLGGNHNIFIGKRSGESVTTGSENIYIGRNLSGSQPADGDRNIAIGYNITTGAGDNQLDIGGAITGDLSTGDVTIANDLTVTGALGLSTSELTIATGIVTATKSYHTIDTEADDATDDLVTISGGSAGFILVVTAAHTDRTVSVTESGNIKLSATPFALDNVEDTLTLIYNGTNWLETSRSDNGS